MKNEHNIQVIVRDKNRQGGFDVYLDFSGNPEYLMSFKYSYALHSVLTAKEWSVGELRRMKSYKVWNQHWGGKDKVRKLESSVRHLVEVIDWYLKERTVDGRECA